MGSWLPARTDRLLCPVLRRGRSAIRWRGFVSGNETKEDEYRYTITPSSLKKAAEQGLKVEHLLVLLAKHSSGGIPPVLVKALKRWEANGTEARVQTQVVLRVSRPEVLEELRKSKAARFLGEMLGPTTVVSRTEHSPKCWLRWRNLVCWRRKKNRATVIPKR